MNWNTEATCYINTSYIAYTVTSWTFESSDPSQYVMVAQASGNTWQGPMIISGTVRAWFTPLSGGMSMPVQASISVGARPAMSWAASVDGRQGVENEIDQCFPTYSGTDSIAGGFTSGKDCSLGLLQQALFSPPLPNQPWYTTGIVPSGPNKGLAYVASTNVTMQIRTQVNRLFRANGPKFAIVGTDSVANACHAVFGNFAARSHFETNTQCFGANSAYKTNFEAFVQTTWAHEGRHKDSALVAARSTQGDLHALISSDGSPSLSAALSSQFRQQVGRSDTARNQLKEPVLFEFKTLLILTAAVLVTSSVTAQERTRPPVTGAQVMQTLHATGSIGSAQRTLQQLDGPVPRALQDELADSMVAFVRAAARQGPASYPNNTIRAIVDALALSGMRNMSGTPYAGAGERLLQLALIVERSTAAAIVYALSELADQTEARARLSPTGGAAGEHAMRDVWQKDLASNPEPRIPHSLWRAAKITPKL